MKKYFDKKQKGAVLVECAISIPLLVYIFLESLNILNTIKIKHDNASIARSVNRMLESGLDNVEATNIENGTRMKEILKDNFGVNADILIRKVNCSNECSRQSEGEYKIAEIIDEEKNNWPDFDADLYNNINHEEANAQQGNNSHILAGGAFNENFNEIVVCRQNALFVGKEKVICDTFVF